MNLAEAITIRDAAKSAYMDALAARAASFGDKTVTRQSIKELREELDRWERVVNDLSRLQTGMSKAAIATWTTR